MKFRTILLTTVAALSITGAGFGAENTKASTDLNEQQTVKTEQAVKAVNYTLNLPTNSYAQLPGHRTGMTYSTSSGAIFVNSNSGTVTSTSTRLTATVYAYYNGVLQHTVTVTVN